MRSSSALASASVSRQITYPDTPNSSGGPPACAPQAAQVRDLLPR